MTNYQFAGALMGIGFALVLVGLVLAMLLTTNGPFAAIHSSRLHWGFPLGAVILAVPLCMWLARLFRS